MLASQFLHLQQVWPSLLGTPMLSGIALGVHTPLSVKAWPLLLADHPNRVWVDSLLKGLERGVRVGFDPNSSFRPAHTNLLSASSHPEVVQRYLDAELACGNGAMWQAHIPPNSCQQGSCSTVLESFQSPINLGSGDLLICHTLGGSSVNDGISTSDSSMVYASIEDAAHFITTLGRGSFLGKMCVCQFHHITSCLLSLVNVPHYVVN